MTNTEVTSHFWVAGAPFFTSTLFITPVIDSPLPRNGGEVIPVRGAEGGRAVTSIAIFDVDGAKTNGVEVEFPSNEVGVLELDPFMAGVKFEGGVQHGHVAVTSRAGARHVCRLACSSGISMVQDPLLIRSRESCFIPLTLGSQKEHMLALVNGGVELAQLSVRLFYGNRSPEWNVVVPPHGAKLIPLQDELLAGQDDRSWERTAVQAYVRVSARHQSLVSCVVVERMPGESLPQDMYRCLASW